MSKTATNRVLSGDDACESYAFSSKAEVDLKRCGVCRFFDGKNQLCLFDKSKKGDDSIK